MSPKVTKVTKAVFLTDVIVVQQNYQKDQENSFPKLVRIDQVAKEFDIRIVWQMRIRDPQHRSSLAKLLRHLDTFENVD